MSVFSARGTDGELHPGQAPCMLQHLCVCTWPTVLAYISHVAINSRLEQLRTRAAENILTRFNHRSNSTKTLSEHLGKTSDLDRGCSGPVG